MLSLEKFYDKNIKKLIKSINENFDDDSPYIDPEEPMFHYDDEKHANHEGSMFHYDDSPYIDPEEPLFHYDDVKHKEHAAPGPERFKGTDIDQCEERLYVNNGKILVTPFSRGKSFSVPVEECEFIVPIRAKDKQPICWVNDSSGKRIGMTEMRK